MIKQYSFEEHEQYGHTLTLLTKWHDGKIYGRTILNDAKRSMTIELLEEQGYSFCYDLEYVYDKYMKAKEAYEKAQRELFDSIDNRVHNQKDFVQLVLGSYNK